jgi:hypothetical protein
VIGVAKQMFCDSGTIGRMDETPVKHIGHPGCERGECLCRVFRHDYTPKDTVLRIARHISQAMDSGSRTPIEPESLLEKIRTELRRYDQKKAAES